MPFTSQSSLKSQLNRVSNLVCNYSFSKNVLNDSHFLLQTVVNYDPIENNDSTVVSAADYNENNGYTYKQPESF